MSILTVIQNFCRVTGLTVPNIIVSSLDVTVLQYLGICNEVLDVVAQDSKYQVFTDEALWTYIAAENQGPLTTIAPGIIFPSNNTFYDRTLRRPIYGPIDDDQWQALKAIPNPGPFYKFRFRGGDLLINPVPTPPLSLIAFEYTSYNLVVTAGGVKQQYFTADTDTCRFPEPILQRGLTFRWKQIKGLPYQADEEVFYDMLNNFISGSKPRPQINLASPDPKVLPGIFVPSGNWHV